MKVIILVDSGGHLCYQGEIAVLENSTLETLDITELSVRRRSCARWRCHNRTKATLKVKKVESSTPLSREALILTQVRTVVTTKLLSPGTVLVVVGFVV